MMWGGYGHGYGLAMGLGWLWGLLILAAVVVVIVLMVRLLTRSAQPAQGAVPPPQPAAQLSPTPRQILEERLAKGEIDTQEFKDRIAALEGK